MMNSAVIALGSNIEPQKHIPTALDAIADTFQVEKKSTFIYTKPLGYENQPDFLNGTVLVQTPLGKEEITTRLKQIEQTMGRSRNGRKDGPRKIDLDLLLFNGQVLDEDIYNRDFLKQSVQQVLPDIDSRL